MLTLAYSRPTKEDAPKRHRILILDDDLPVLLTLKRAFRRDYDVDVALNPKQALEILYARDDIAVVLSDMKMPGMDGVAFLKQAFHAAPQAARIMLTGDTNRDTAISALNEGRAFRFLEKPCSTEEIECAILDGISEFERNTQPGKNIVQVLAGFQKKLNTPLQHIASYAKLIENGSVTAQSMKEYAEQIRESSSEVLESSETLLDLMMMQSGCFTPSFEVLEPTPWIRASISKFRRLAQAKGIHINFDTLEERFELEADPTIFARALDAILRTAVKHAQIDGNISVIIEYAGEDRSHITIKVSDDGPGVPEQARKILSQKNMMPFQASDSKFETHELCLPYIQSVADVHGGSLDISPSGAETSYISMTLPITPQCLSIC